MQDQSKKKFDVIIIGAGAAGLMTAISANQRGKTVLLLEKNSRAGQKILISGGGRCNFTNLNVTADHFFSQNSKFCLSALKSFKNTDWIDWVKEAKIEFYEKTLGQLFCKKSSKQILQLLLDKLSTQLTQIKTEVTVHAVSYDESENFFIVKTDQGLEKSKKLVLATGGLSYPQLGATDLGYQIAQQFGHTVTDLAPALDGFVWKTMEAKYFSECTGVAVKANVIVEKKQFQENILFTHKGLSGPAMLKASLFWNKNQSIQIDFLPDLKDFKKWFHEARQKHSKKTLGSVLLEFLPQKIVKQLCRYVAYKNKIPDFENQKIAECSKKVALSLELFLKSFTFIPESTVGYKTAEVTRGGVDTAQISSKTMESKMMSGLYFVGELVDVTGLLGGYNFQWAWSSGWVAGQNV